MTKCKICKKPIQFYDGEWVHRSLISGKIHKAEPEKNDERP